MVVKTLLDLLNIGIEVWLGYWLFDVPSCRRFQKRWTVVLEYIMFLGMPGGMVLLNRLAGIRFANGMWIFQAILFVIASVIFTKYKIRRSFAWAAFYYTTILVLELPGVILDGWLDGRPYFQSIYSDKIYTYIYLLLITIFLGGIAYICGSKIREVIKVLFNGNLNFLWVLFALIEFQFTAFFLRIGFTESGSSNFIFGILLMVCIILLISTIFILQFYRQMDQKLYKRMIQDKELELAYEKIKNEYQEKSRKIHDYKHQLNTLDCYFQEKQYKDAETYLKSILGNLQGYCPEIKARTGLPLIDAILSRKIENATRYSIKLKLDIQPIHTSVSEQELSIMLSNILDNAIEAAQICGEGQRWINIVIRSKRKMQCISVENSLTVKPEKKEGHLISTKADKINHGWGISSIERVVENNDGYMEYDYDNQKFRIYVEFFR